MLWNKMQFSLFPYGPLGLRDSVLNRYMLVSKVFFNASMQSIDMTERYISAEFQTIVEK